MSEYAYISKDESYAIKHYGVKGMKWHKHLKAKFDNKIGLSQRRAYYDTIDYYGQPNTYSSMKHPSSTSDRRFEESRIKQTEKRAKEYGKTPLGKAESALYKIDRDDRIQSLLTKKKSQKQLDREAKRRVKKRDRKLEKVYKKIDDDYRNQNKLGNGMTMVRLAELPSARRIQKERLAIAKSREIAKEYANRDKTSALKVQQRRNLKRANAQKSLEEAKERRKRKYMPLYKWKYKRTN